MIALGQWTQQRAQPTETQTLLAKIGMKKSFEVYYLTCDLGSVVLKLQSNDHIEPKN